MMRMNSRIGALAVAALLPLATTGCAEWTRAERGAVIGAGAGAAAGAAVGHATGSTARGAIIGAAVGGVAGAVIGREMDRQADELAANLEGADVTRIGEGIAVTFPSGLLFDFDSDALRAEVRADLRNLANNVQQYEGREMLVVGHTDSIGSASYNQGLSERRARSVADYLVSQGVPRATIQTAGRGETEPIASNDTPEGRQQNRRVEVAIFASEAYRQQIQSQNP